MPAEITTVTNTRIVTTPNRAQRDVDHTRDMPPCPTGDPNGHERLATWHFGTLHPGPLHTFVTCPRTMAVSQLRHHRIWDPRAEANRQRMYPILFSVGGFEITSFGVLVAVAALVGVSLFRRELAWSGLPENAVDGAILGVLAGLAGAKLLWVAEHRGEDAFTSLLFSRGGLSWFGGLVGGVGAALVFFLAKGYPLVRTVAAASPALAAGHAIGRIGCFLVGDDYGRPTTLPWGVAFPRGLPPTVDRVHPTQLYEAVVLAVLSILLVRWRRSGVSDHRVLGRYLLVAGVTRFLIEFIRVNERVVGGLTVAHIAALLMMLAGLAVMAGTSRTATVNSQRRRP